MVVLIPKRNGEFWGIGLVGILWKALLGVIKRRIGASVNFCDILHVFWLVWGTGNSSLKAKMIHQLTKIIQEVLYKVFLNL